MDKLKHAVKALNKVCDEDNMKKILHHAYSSLKNIVSFNDRYEHTLSSLKKNCKSLSDYLVLNLT